MNNDLLDIITHFDSLGSDFVVGKRNKIKIIPYNTIQLNVKSFKIPSFPLGVMYRFFRKSKAKRSYEYAQILKAKGIGTPNPIAFYENKTFFRILDSYYICEHLTPDYVFKELFNVHIEDLESILRQFTHFTFQLHESGIEFLDHSPGNTLLKKGENGKYEFYLVDLNRMKFHDNMSFETRMKNFARITPSETWVKIISSEYAKLYQKSEDEVFQLMWQCNVDFYGKVNFKRKIKTLFGIK